MAETTQSAQRRLSFAEIDSSGEVWEYAALVTSLSDEILTLGQLYRDRADCENTYDELKNHWGWGGFTTQDLKRLLAGVPARPLAQPAPRLQHAFDLGHALPRRFARPVSDSLSAGVRQGH